MGAFNLKAEGGAAATAAPREPGTVAELAAAKGLPEAFLREQGLGDCPAGGVSVAYYDADGGDLFVRRRGVPGKRFDQPAGVQLVPYGRWRLAEGGGRPLFLTEGETDCLTLWHRGRHALGVPGSNSARCLSAEDLAYADTVYVCPDNDKAGLAFAAGVVARLNELAWAGRAYTVFLPRGVKDVNDLHRQLGEHFDAGWDELVLKAKRAATAPHVGASKWAAQPNAGRRPAVEPKGWVLEDLLAAELPEPKWLIPGLLSEGLNVLVGRPKQGKSFMALNLALTVAAGGLALGDVKVPAAKVLYLSLEDKDRRVQARARKIVAGLKVDLGRRLEVYTAWPRMGEGGLEALADWAERSGEEAGLVVIDVLKKFKPPARGKGNAYDEDYEVLSPIKELADERRLNLLVIHHTKKAKSEDWIDDVSGSSGVTGVADGVLMLVRDRGEDEGSLLITGRDVDERKIAVKFDRETCAWTSLGDADKHTESKLGRLILDYFRGQPKVMFWPREVAESLKQDRNLVCSQLSRMAGKGMVYRQGGRYGWPPDPPDERERAF